MCRPDLHMLLRNKIELIVLFHEACVLRVQFVRFFCEVHCFVGLDNLSRTFLGEIYECATITTSFSNR